MELTTGRRLHGFAVRYVHPLPELHATLYRMEYEKNGADLVWLDRDDDNKTFSIAFKTIPQDDTGVFHILEHSVLCLTSTDTCRAILTARKAGHSDQITPVDITTI